METETVTMTTETTRDGVEGYLITETVITRVYDEKGVLQATSKDGPHEVNFIPKTAFNEDIIQTTQQSSTKTSGLPSDAPADSENSEG